MQNIREQSIKEILILNAQISLNRRAYEDKMIPYELYSEVNRELKDELHRLEKAEGLTEIA